MRRAPKVLVGVAGGLALAAVAASLMSTDEAVARGRRGGALRLVDINVAEFAGVPQNDVIEMTFTSPVDPRTVNHAVFQIREENATGTGFTVQVPGSFQVQRNVVRFYPRLPTHLRDPADPDGGFYVEGTAKDDANENAAFQPLSNYEIKIVGHPAPQAVRSTKGRKLVRSFTKRFTTSPSTPKTQAFTIDTYQDAPPPGFEFSNPPDKVASAVDQYARHGGTREVPNGIAVTLFGNKVPLSPNSVRGPGNVSLTLTERNGDTSVRKPIAGSVFVEQNFDTTKLLYQPRFPLPDLGTYALRVTKDVKDLTEQYNFRNNPERLRLREIYEFMAAARALSPQLPPEQLSDPPLDLIFDWPTDPVERGVLKANVLALGDTYPDEVDPRVMVLFTTRDEPVSNGKLILEFEGGDGNFNSDISSASWDEVVPGAVAAILTIAGGSGVNGDYLPAASATINTDSFPGNTINWRKLRIPPGVVITLEGTRPAVIKALDIEIEGEIRADGKAGQNAPTGSYYTGTSAPPQQKGGPGGPGGGKGGDSSKTFQPNSTGIAGEVGNDDQGVKAAPEDGGRGGLGGVMGNSSAYEFGGGGGGGGARTAGTAGAAAPGGGQPGWGGAGGNGGAGSSNDDLSPLVGGAGGGSGGNAEYALQNWYKSAGAGGGGGGAVMLQTSGILTIGTQGMVRARGGVGGAGTGTSGTISAAPGGGGGGGSILLRSTKGFNIANAPAAFDVRGGAGGTQSGGSYGAPNGGTGGTGYVRLEDPNGGVQVPGGSVGNYDPVGGGVPSYAYTHFLDIGVDQPRFVNFSKSDFLLSATANDAVLVEMQAAVEDPNNFGQPLLTALDPATQNTTDPAIVSEWKPIRILDNTGTPGDGAFGSLPDYDPGIHSRDYVFPAAAYFNGKNYKFVRFRVTFQLDQTQASTDPFPYLDRLVFNFQFNF